MAKEFLGQGWRFPIQPDASGKLGYTAKEENVAQALEILTQTTLGERLMRPGYGTRAAERVFAPGSARYLRLLETDVREAIVKWEPRVEVIDVRAEAEPDDAARVLVSIDYAVRGTNTRDNLVFPFYSEGGAVLS